MSHESISALLDGECTPEELERLLDEMERSPELKLAYSRQCAVREAAAGTRITRNQPDLCAGIMARLDEPVAESGNPRVVPIVRAPRPALQWRSAAGLAAAAALGAVAVLVAVPQTRDAGSTVATATPMTVSPSAGTMPVSVPMPSIRHRGNLQTVSVSPEQLQQDQLQQDELREYMMDHNYAVSDRGMSTTLSSARFAAHTAEYRPAAEEGDPR